ncbi:RNA polymerase sigma-I factor [Desulfotruncus alcoholivorax]|uniref:RNA polymerase sigma-I factor n=1 Tax=Desulfotruncus alcoholivorax TaxID=265477 RepID=UPI00041B3ACB|nr:RNA polymerase sigma-I factor [Desulfotruncus alcoholivorax]
MLLGDEFESHIAAIKDGDESSREILINEAKPFIAGVTGRLCGRSLSWGSDDELSIGLIAFNEAIDRFKAGQGVPFTAFARLVIRSRVTDYLRRESRWNKVDLASQEPAGNLDRSAELTASWDQYVSEIVDRERKEEIIIFSNRLNRFGISFTDLVNVSPKHKDTRKTLITAAQFIVENNLYPELLSSNRLPLKEISAATGISRKVLERGRKYIMAVSTLLYYRDEFIYLRAYIKEAQGGD